jgi:hypothetical protein
VNQGFIPGRIEAAEEEGLAGGGAGRPHTVPVAVTPEGFWCCPSLAQRGHPVCGLVLEHVRAAALRPRPQRRHAVYRRRVRLRLSSAPSASSRSTGRVCAATSARALSTRTEITDRAVRDAVGWVLRGTAAVALPRAKTAPPWSSASPSPAWARSATWRQAAIELGRSVPRGP